MFYAISPQRLCISQAKAADHAAPCQNQGKRVKGTAGPPEPERAQ